MHHNLEIVPGADKPMSPEQLLFNSRIEKINVWKAKLNKVRLKIDTVKKRISEDIGPVQQKANEADFKLVKRLDEVFKKYKFNEIQQMNLIEVIIKLIVPLKMTFHNEELIALHDEYMQIVDKHIAESQKGMTEEEINEELEGATDITKEFIKNMIFEQTGVELEDEDLKDVDLNDPSSFQRIMMDVMQRIQQQSAEEAQQSKTFKQKKTKPNEETSNLNKTSRRIYTELIKLLHPDRSKDEEERTWKTEAIKEVTEAYEKNDFYALLQLQIKYIEKAAGDIKELTGKRLNHYNGLLLQQLKDLQDQYNQITKFGPEAILYKEIVKSKKRYNEYVKEQKTELEMKIEDIEDDLDNLKTKTDVLGFVDYVLNPPLFDDSILDLLFGD